MKMRILACLAFFLNTVFFGTYYAISKEALGRIDPIIFTYFELMALAPVALCIIAWTWQDITQAVLRRGILLGSSLCLALFTIAIALKYTTATSTAFFPSLNGLLAALIASVFLRQPITKATWFAAIVSVVGTLLLIFNSSMGGLRGTLIAFLGGVFFTCYVFLSDQQHNEGSQWTLFGIELITMAVWANLIVLLFGEWNTFHPDLPKDIWVILFVAGACTFLPTLITVLMQKYVSAITVSFIYILEPIIGALAANIYLHEMLPLDGYIGGLLVIVGAIIQTWSAAERPRDTLSLQQRLLLNTQQRKPSWKSTLGYPLLFFSAGAALVLGLGGFLPPAWLQFYKVAPLLPDYIGQGKALFVFLITAQAFCWLIAWAALITMAYLIINRLITRKFATDQKSDSIDTSYLRQMGITSYTPSTALKRTEKLEVQRRRRERKERMARTECIELVE